MSQLSGMVSWMEIENQKYLLFFFFSDKKAEIDSLAAAYIESVKSMLPEERVEHLRKIQSAYSKCKEYSDDKVQLAMQTYEMVSHELWKSGNPLEWCMWRCFTASAFPDFFFA